MILLIDLDGVTADFWGAIINYSNNEFGTNVTKNDLHSYELNNNFPNKGRLLSDHINSDGFFYNLEVIRDADVVIDSLLSDGHEIYFVTATPVSSPTGYYDKCRWIDKYFKNVGHKRIISAYHKFMVNGHLLFDDSQKNIVEFQQLNGNKTVIMDYKYNNDVNSDYRVSSWIEFKNVVDSLRI